MIFHRHAWEVIDRCYAPPTLTVDDRKVNFTTSEDFAERCIHGVTTWILRCPGCGAMRTERALGQVQR